MSTSHSALCSPPPPSHIAPEVAACAQQGALAHRPCCHTRLETERWPQAHEIASSRTPGQRGGRRRHVDLCLVREDVHRDEHEGAQDKWKQVSNSCFTAYAHHISLLSIQKRTAKHETERERNTKHLHEVVNLESLPLDVALACCRLPQARRPSACARQGALAHCPCRHTRFQTETERWPRGHKTASSRTPGQRGDSRQ